MLQFPPIYIWLFRITMRIAMDKEHYLISVNSIPQYIGDDAAVVGDTLYSMDAFFEDVHFKREWMSMAADRP